MLSVKGFSLSLGLSHRAPALRRILRGILSPYKLAARQRDVFAYKVEQMTDAVMQHFRSKTGPAQIGGINKGPENSS